jgi:protein N-terminal methyltransferase
LVPGGYIVVKENVCLDTGFVLDSQDASVTRSVPLLRQLVERAGLRVVYQQWEKNFPDDIFPVPMLALQPR